MTQSKKIISLIFLFLWLTGKSQHIDTAFFEVLKRFYVQKTAHQINPELYTKWAKQTSSPFHYVYVSASKKVRNANPDHDYYYCGHDSTRAQNYCIKMTGGGFSVFHYKTFGTSDALVTHSLMKYRIESRTFVVFHELTHNYIKENKLDISYLLNEAACDVTGVEFSRLIGAEKNILDLKILNEQVSRLEAIYSTINETVKLIEADSSRCKKYCKAAEKKIKKQLAQADTFYKDRFNYKVNTAYLLKNQNYCRYYFELRKFYAESRDYPEFIEKIKAFNTKI